MAFELPEGIAMVLSKDTAHICEEWTQGRLVEEIDPETGDKTIGLNFPGSEGVMRASEGDYVVCMKSDGTFQRWSAAYLKHRVEALL